MKRCSTEVVIDGKTAKLTYEYNKNYYNLYIENYLTLLHIDGPIDIGYEANKLYDNVLNDISSRKIEIFKYKLFWYCRYDFAVMDSAEWDDYPRPTNLSLALIRILGRKETCGYLKLKVGSSTPEIAEARNEADW